MTQGEQKAAINRRKSYVLRKEGNTYSCCTDEATRRRGRYRHKHEGRGEKQRERQGKKQEGREKGEKREHRTPGGDSNMGARLT